METIPVRHLNQTLKEPCFSGSFDILDLEVYLSGKDMVQELHRHSFFYILVLEKGKGTHHIDFIPHPVQDDAVFIMRPGQVHELSLENGSTGYLLKFSPDFYAPLSEADSQVLRKVSSKDFYVLSRDTMENVLFLLRNIYKENKEKQESYMEAIRSYLAVFFIKLLRQSQEAAVSANHSSDYMQERLEAFQELIITSAAQFKQVSHYAEQLNLSTYQLNAITKARLNKTCSELINDNLLLEAKRYLLATSNQVNQIAWHLGYEDVSYFVRFFKKHTGYSPEAFRKTFIKP